jgi:hypothetical protein
MKRVILIIVCCFSIISFSQYDIDEAKKEEEKKEEKLNPYELKKNIYLGGDFAFSMRGGTTYLNLSPLIGYDITKRFSAGISGMYQFWRIRYFNTTFNINTVGAGIFTRYRPVEWLITQVEFDLYNSADLFSADLERINVPAFMAGVGFARPFGEGAYGQIILLYDFIDNQNMPLPPVIITPLHLRMGFVWHLN